MFKNSVTKANYAQKAEAVIKSLGKPDKFGGLYFELTTTQIRNLLTLINQLYNDVITGASGETLHEDIRSRFEYLRVRMAYESGRTKAVKAFVEKAELLNMQSEVGSDRGKFILFCRYFEALVAYHKYYGGRD